jgi:pyruvate/2-oxoglutarate dehydrogenase complex dihydrolipoamide dehydrogenase (E3) component
VFFAVGWPASLDALNLDVAGVVTEPGWIPVDDYLRTNVGHIFAAGDVDGRSMLVPTARTEGRLADTNAILGPSRQASCSVVPSGSFTDPEYGRVGLTEAEAAQQHDADRRERTMLGAHVLGEYSAETVQTVAACTAAGMTVEQVAELQFAFPTFTEGPAWRRRRSAGPSASEASRRSGAISALRTDGRCRPAGRVAGGWPAARRRPRPGRDRRR